MKIQRRSSQESNQDLFSIIHEAPAHNDSYSSFTDYADQSLLLNEKLLANSFIEYHLRTSNLTCSVIPIQIMI